MAFREPGLLHAIIFCASIVNSVEKSSRERPVAVMHLQQAIAIVNERLHGPAMNITDAIIVVVSALAQTEVGNNLSYLAMESLNKSRK